MKRTTAPGSLSGQYIDFESSPGAPGTLLTAEDRNTVQEEICSPIEGASITLSGSDSGQLFKAIKKIVVEKSKNVGEIFWHQERKSPVAWSSESPDAYFPAICLTAIDSYLDISSTNWPLLVPYLRSVKTKYNDGITGEIENFGTNSTSTLKDAAGVVTATLSGSGGSQLVLALYEDYRIHGSYNNFRYIRLNQDIFTGANTVVSGFYPITQISLSPSYSISFSTGVAGATSSTSDIYFSLYPYYVPTATSARLFSLRGLGIHGINDQNGYFINSCRRRGYFQGHYTVPSISSQYGSGGVSFGAPRWSASDTTRQTIAAQVPTDDGTNGVPRVCKETHSPSFSCHIYMHGGIYV